ncbi:MAG: hypothetical protein HY056_03345, partial [Proteobacteria bacterium]|nr:hypothetical protein [Pseudomonadota bacterium]
MASVAAIGGAALIVGPLRMVPDGFLSLTPAYGQAVTPPAKRGAQPV